MNPTAKASPAPSTPPVTPSTEADLLVNHDRLNFIFNITNDLISIIDRDYHYVMVNDRYCQIYGFPREQMLGQSVGDIWGADKFETLLVRRFERCFAGEIIHDEAWIPCGELGERYMQIAYYPLLDEGRVAQTVVISHDITELKQTEKLLREREAIYKNIVENSLDLIVTTDRDGDYLFLNPAASRLFRRGKNYQVFVHREDLERTRGAWDRVLAGEQLARFENRVLGPEDKIIYLAWTAAPLLNERNEVTGSTAIARDITDQRRLELLAQEVGLSAREMQILDLVAQGFTNLNIASLIEIQESTVKFHMNRIFRKTKTQSRTELLSILR